MFDVKIYLIISMLIIGSGLGLMGFVIVENVLYWKYKNLTSKVWADRKWQEKLAWVARYWFSAHCWQKFCFERALPTKESIR